MPHSTLPLQSAFERHRVLDSRSPDEAREVVGRIFCPHFLEPRERQPHGFHARHSSVRQAGYSINHVAYGAEVDIDPGELANFFLLQVPVVGSADVACGSAQVTAAAGRVASVLSPTLQTRMRWHQGCEKIIVLIDRVHMETYYHALTDRNGPIEFLAGIDLTSPFGRTLLRQVQLLSDTATDDWRAPDAYQKTLRDGICSLLLQNVAHGASERLDRPAPVASPLSVRRAEAYVLDHLDRSISMPDVAEAAGVCLRSLQDIFRRVHGQTLTGYIQARRLEAFHARLLAADPTASVADLAFATGLGHLGRAAAAYRRRYGVPPSDTLRRRQ